MLRLFIHCSDMRKYSKEKNQETILAIILGLLVIWYFTHVKELVFVSLALAFIGLLVQTVASWITWFWLKLSHAMGWVMSKVIMSLVFYLVLFPIALLSRLFTKGNLQLKKSSSNSYYKDRSHVYEANELENPW